MEPVEATVAERLSDGVVVPLDDESLEQLRAAACAVGTDTTSLVHKWIAENLAKLRRSS